MGCPLHTAQATVIPRRGVHSLVKEPLIGSPTSSSMDVCWVAVVVSNDGGTSPVCWRFAAEVGAPGVVWPFPFSRWLGGGVGGRRLKPPVLFDLVP